MTTVIELEQVVRQGAASLAESLRFYWPSFGRNDICENNISLHLGAALIANGFALYGQAHNREDANFHLDLLAMHPSRGTLVAGEFKRLYRPRQAHAMLADLDRIRTWRLAEERVTAHMPHQFGVLAATTWDALYADWFQTSQAADPCRGPLATLREKLPGDNVRWGASLLLKGLALTTGERIDVWMVYVIFPL